MRLFSNSSYVCSTEATRILVLVMLLVVEVEVVEVVGVGQPVTTSAVTAGAVIVPVPAAFAFAGAGAAGGAAASSGVAIDCGGVLFATTAGFPFLVPSLAFFPPPFPLLVPEDEASLCSCLKLYGCI